MHPTQNTLSEDIRTQSIEQLNKHLAAAIDLHAQVKQAHWNVRGPSFIAVHELFDRVSVDVETFSDMIAERCGGLGGLASGGIQTSVKQTYLLPYPVGIADETKHIFAVSTALATFGEAVRNSIDDTAASGDAVTADLLTEVCRGVDRQLWFVESHKSSKPD